jgi:SAM-dependent methyltransferase
MNTFNDLYFEKRLNIAWRAKAVVDAFLKHFPAPTLVYDIGCSVGEFVKEFNDRGIKAIGYEVSTPALKHLLCQPNDVIIRDWSARIVKGLPPPADLLLFFEVAPFLTDNQQRKMALNLVNLTKTILTTSPEECAKYFLEKDFYEDFMTERQIKDALEPLGHKPAIKSLYRSLKVYRKL